MNAPSPDRRASPILVAVPLGLVLGTYAIIVQKMAKPISNTDTYFHLRLGQEFLDGWSPRGPGSVTRFANAEWIPTQWLSQVAYAQFERWFGLSGVAWLSGAVVLLFSLVLFLVARRESSLVVAAFIVPVTVVACSSALSGRPQVASYIFTTLVTSAWLETKRSGKVPWWIIPMTWVWAMLHGMWSVGVLVSLVAVLGLALERQTPRPDLVKMLFVPVLSVVAAGLTPMGVGIYTSTLRVGSISQYFAEWGPTQFTAPHVAVAAAMAVGALVLGLRSGPMQWLPLLLLLLASAWLAYSTRTVPVAATMLAPLLAAELNRVVPPRERHRVEGPVVIIGFITALAVLALIVPHASNETINANNKAEVSVGSLSKGTALLNEWGNGGHTMWRHPDLDIVMHGYGDMFTDAELKRNYEITTLEPGWLEALRELGVTEALLDSEGSIAYVLTETLGWEVVVEDEPLVHLRAPAGWSDETPD